MYSVLMDDLANITTEARNPRSSHIDELSTLEMLSVIQQEDATVAAAVATQLEAIAHAVDAIAERFARGGRLFYIGAGTSGRLGVLDASECPPTFSVPPDLVQGLIAGGDRALRLSSEHSEDSPEEGAQDLIAAGFGIRAVTDSGISSEDPNAPSIASSSQWVAADSRSATGSLDTLVGIAASGRTPYVLGALLHARSIGALTIGLSCVADSPVAQHCDLAITPVTGPEIITGSTRMKAGTATKLVLNMLSTGVMIRTGAVYGNLMVNVKPTNAKLVDRAHRIIVEATGCDRPTAERLLAETGSVKVAIAMQKLGLARSAAESRLAATGGSLARALRA
ncbi:MAG: N-acetylmuramic acid 6-phosphate etherase [Acidobacteriaceae bacterium]|nr:N-acetylmuramic acid 6-phosphate etherase [Acidobacteriaceae bacterium]